MNNTGDSKQVLIADDDNFFRIRLGDILAEAGHKIRFAASGSEVIEEIKKNPAGIDLLTLDLQMPDIDGFGVLEWINENGYKGRFPVLVVSGVSEPSHVIERLKALGAAGLMTKSFTPEDTLSRVNKILFPGR